MKFEQAFEQLNALPQGAINSHSAAIVIVKLNDGKVARLPLTAGQGEQLAITEFIEPTEAESAAEDWDVIQ